MFIRFGIAPNLFHGISNPLIRISNKSIQTISVVTSCRIPDGLLHPLPCDERSLSIFLHLYFSPNLRNCFIMYPNLRCSLFILPFINIIIGNNYFFTVFTKITTRICHTINKIKTIYVIILIKFPDIR